MTAAHPEVTFIPVLSHAGEDASWTGATGYVRQVVCTELKRQDIDGGGDAYACGPPPMIDALSPVLFLTDFDPDRTFFDKFTPSTAHWPIKNTGTYGLVPTTKERDLVATSSSVGTGAAGAAIFADSESRKHCYYEPRAKRATHYEDVTVDVQPDPER